MCATSRPSLAIEDLQHPTFALSAKLGSKPRYVASLQVNANLMVESLPFEVFFSTADIKTRYATHDATHNSPDLHVA